MSAGESDQTNWKKLTTKPKTNLHPQTKRAIRLIPPSIIYNEGRDIYPAELVIILLLLILPSQVSSRAFLGTFQAVNAKRKCAQRPWLE